MVGRDGLRSSARVLQLLIGARGWSQEERGDHGFLVVLSDDGLARDEVLGGREAHVWQQVGKWGSRGVMGTVAT